MSKLAMNGIDNDFQMSTKAWPTNQSRSAYNILDYVNVDANVLFIVIGRQQKMDVYYSSIH